jgi:NIPSNAP protein
MRSRKWLLLISSVALFLSGLVVGSLAQQHVDAQAGNRVFELRTYTAPDGKLDSLNARFRNHTVGIFKKHAMTSVGYFVPQDAPSSQNTLIYILAHPSREAAKANWAAFQADPEWVKARTESEVNGRLTTKVESVFLNPTDYSPMK